MSKTYDEQIPALRETQLQGSRRSFLKFGGATLATTGLLLSGCKEFIDLIPVDDVPGVKTVNLGKGDVGILNYALVLEQLEAAFYTLAVATPYNGISSEERVILDDLRQHEVVHREFLRAALGKDAIPTLAFDFSSINFGSRNSVLGAAKLFEDLGVAAYNGAGRLLKNPDFLLIAGKIVSVEGRHAAAIRSIFDEDPTSFAGSDILDDNALDRAFSPDTVLEMASGFIITKINANQLPKS